MINQKNSQLVKIKVSSWRLQKFQSQWVKDLEDGKVLYIENLNFQLRLMRKNFLHRLFLIKIQETLVLIQGAT